MSEDNIIDGVCERIMFDRVKLEGEGLPRIEVDSFNLSEFWSQFGSAVQALSNEVTKVSFMCNTKPFPTKPVVSVSVLDILQYYNMMRDLYLVLPQEVGTEVFKATTTALLNITTALYDVVRSFCDLNEKASEDRLKFIAVLWDACNAVQSLPKNNLLATLNLFEEESDLASDALEELKTVVKNSDLTPAEYDKSKRDSGNSTVHRETDKEAEESNPSDFNMNNKVSLSEAEMNSSRHGLITDTQTSSKQENQDQSKGDGISENEHDIVETWAIEQIARNKSADLATLEEDLTAVSIILLKILQNINDPIFFGLAPFEKVQKRDRLRSKYSTLLLIKDIIVRSPEILERVTASVQNLSGNDKNTLIVRTNDEIAIPNGDEKTLCGTLVPESSQIQTLIVSSHQTESNSVLTSWRPQLSQQTGRSGPIRVEKQLLPLSEQDCSSGSIFAETSLVPFSQQAGSHATNPDGTNVLSLCQQADSSGPNHVVTSWPSSQQIGGSAAKQVEKSLFPLNQQADSSTPIPVETSWLPLSEQASSCTHNPVETNWPKFNETAGSSGLNPVETSQSVLSQIAGSFRPIPTGLSWLPLKEQAGCSTPNPDGTSWSTLDVKADFNISNYVEMPQNTERALNTWVRHIIRVNKPVNMATLENEISYYENLVKQGKRKNSQKKLYRLLNVKKGFEACQARGVSVLNFTTVNYVLPEVVVQDPYHSLQALQNKLQNSQKSNHFHMLKVDQTEAP